MIAEPIRLRPLYMERPWGGRTLSLVYGRPLPDERRIGESWEVVDRDGEQSVVDGGALDGLTLHQLWKDHHDEVFGTAAPPAPRFPLLIKILDARERLSIQVHPPASIAATLGGEPKTEMWYIAHAEPDAALYVGVRDGVDAAAFARAIDAGTVAEVVHRLPVQTGQFIFVPSGRLHAIGAGLLIFEIQQSSDTTYRVYDWGRLGLDGKPRALHVKESLACIDFADTAPTLGVQTGRVLVDCPYFVVSRFDVSRSRGMTWGTDGEFSILALVGGDAILGETRVRAGDVLLVPASMPGDRRAVHAESDATFLHIAFSVTEASPAKAAAARSERLGS